MREEDRNPPEADGNPSFLAKLLIRADRLLALLVLTPLDGAIGFLQRSRNRIAPPATAAEDSRDNRRRTPVAEKPAAAPATTPTPHRLRSFLFLLLALVIGALAGMTFSYRLLTKALDADSVLIDYQQDEIRQLGKEEKLNLNARAKLQEQVDAKLRENRDYRTAIDDYQNQIESYKNQVASLNRQLSAQGEAVYSSQPRAPKRSMSYSSKHTPQARAPAKTGICVMNPGDTPADLARCVQDFNRN